MKKMISAIVVVAVLAAVLISGCTQTAGPSGGTGGVIDKAAEDKAAATLESELDQALANMSDQDIENALLNQ